MLDLFSGIGGFSLAASWVWGDELEIVSFVEIDKYCQKVLNKNFPGVPIHDDIKTFDGTKYRGTIDLITGGFPCQPYSIAGKQKGEEDDRALWSEMFRVISEVQPTWIIGENVSGFVNMGIDDCISDMEGEGYEVQSFIIPACAQNAPHRRDRIWIVAHSKGIGKRTRSGTIQEKNGKIQQRNNNAESCNTSEDAQNPLSSRMRRRDNGNKTGSERTLQVEGSDCHVTDSINNGLERVGKEWETKGQVGLCGGTRCDKIKDVTDTEKAERKSAGFDGNPWDEPWLEVATRLCRVDDGISDRVHRLKSLGNAIVPQVVYPIMKIIKDINEH